MMNKLGQIFTRQNLSLFVGLYLKCFAVFSVLTVMWIGGVFALSGYGQTPAAFDFVTYLLFWNPDLIMQNGRLLFGRMVLMMLFNALFWGLVCFAYKKINAKKNNKDVQ